MPQGDAFATMSSTEALARLATSQATGLTSAEAASRLAKYGINGIVEKEGSTLKKLLGYFTGSDLLHDRGGGSDLRLARTMVGLRHHHRAPVLQRHHRLLARPQGGKCAGGAEEGARTRSRRAEGRQMADDQGSAARSGRYRAAPYRPDRSGRSQADRRHGGIDRSIGIDRRVAAGGQEDRRSRPIRAASSRTAR